MSGPRHLWSGDWERESAAAADELAGRRDPVPVPPEEPAATIAPPPPEPIPAAPRPRRTEPSKARIAWTALRTAATRNGKRMAAAVVVVLLAAAASFAAVSAVTGGFDSTPKPRPAWLGVQMASSPVLAGGFQSGFGGFPFATGAVITAVVPGSPAAAAGLQPGDVITEVGADQVSTPAGVTAAIAHYHAGDHITVAYGQGPLSYTTEVTLKAPPVSTP